MRSETTAVATWFGFLLMCVGMFMAILDIQVVATSLPTIQRRARYFAGGDELDPDRLSDRGSDRDSADRPADARAEPALAVRQCGRPCSRLASIGCALSGGFAVLLAFRVVQGFAGGVLIPAVFSAVFLLFPPRLHAVATTIGGVVAVLAPTIGPVVGGYITDTWSWPWLFLINVIPGLIAAGAAPCLLPRQRDAISLNCRSLICRTLALLAVALASLEIGLKQAPQRGWLSVNCVALLRDQRLRPHAAGPAHPCARRIRCCG